MLCIRKIPQYLPDWITGGQRINSIGNLANAKETASGEALAMVIKENKSAATEKNNLSTGLVQHKAIDECRKSYRNRDRIPSRAGIH